MEKEFFCNSLDVAFEYIRQNMEDNTIFTLELANEIKEVEDEPVRREVY